MLSRYKKDFSVLVAVLTSLFAPHHAMASEPWGYAEGTERWGLSDPAYARCSDGLQQSPIDVLRRSASTGSLPKLRFRYAGTTGLTIANVGHTVQGIPTGTSNTLSIGDKVYTLAQFHVHAPSETFIDGEQYPLEIHFVHRASDGSLAVVGQLFDEGRANDDLEPFIGNLPEEEGHQRAISSFHMSRLVPTSRLYRFSGSLTTPPCSEGVAWHIAGTPRTASLEQLAKIAAMYHGHEFPGGNRRPVQALNGRRIYTTGESD